MSCSRVSFYLLTFVVVGSLWVPRAEGEVGSGRGNFSGPEELGTLASGDGSELGDIAGVTSADIRAMSSYGLVGAKVAGAFGQLRHEEESSLRGAKEAKLYKQASPAVVLVVTEDGVGSGSLINRSGDILTNWHVVRGYDRVGVIFKPRTEGKELTAADIRGARVVRFDQVADLALLRVEKAPSEVSPVAIGDMAEVEIGSDVHAIGHPTGQSWTYTKGVVSQLRESFEWEASGSDKRHKAAVIQTQTPINPGNSGGPLLSDKGRLIGVNSFKSSGEGLNFAVAVSEVNRFLASTENRLALNAVPAPAKECEPKEVFKGKHPTIKKTSVIAVDLNCDGEAELEIRVPDDEKKAAIVVIDANKDSKPDVLIIDENRDGKWDVSLYDTDYDGKWDLVGEHPDGDIEASRLAAYKDSKG